MGYSLYTKHAVQNHVHRVSTYTMPVAGYWALFLTDPTPGSIAGVPTGTECSYTGYARQAGTFAADAGGVIANNTAVNFPSAGTINSTANFMGFMDSATLGAGILIEGFSIPAEAINVGTIVSAAIGALISTLA